MAGFSAVLKRMTVAHQEVTESPINAGPFNSTEETMLSAVSATE
jgi:hypothetical protein